MCLLLEIPHYGVRNSSPRSRGLCRALLTSSPFCSEPLEVREAGSGAASLPPLCREEKATLAVSALTPFAIRVIHSDVIPFADLITTLASKMFPDAYSTTSRSVPAFLCRRFLYILFYLFIVIIYSIIYKFIYCFDALVLLRSMRKPSLFGSHISAFRKSVSLSSMWPPSAFVGRASALRHRALTSPASPCRIFSVLIHFFSIVSALLPVGYGFSISIVLRDTAAIS